jgi:hypothetical protein
MAKAKNKNLSFVILPEDGFYENRRQSLYVSKY